MSKEEAQAEPDETRPRGRSRALLVAGLALALLASALPSALSAEGGTERVSVDSTGEAPDARSFAPAISADGRYVAFASEASDLVDSDGNATTDVFVFDEVTGTTERVSRTASGDADGPSTAPAISGDGRFVAFTSGASDLVSGDSNAGPDVFVRDRDLGTTERVSLSAGADPDIGSFDPSISADGRYVAFASDASDLVADDTNGSTDVFVHDRQLHTTERVSVDTDEVEANGASSGAAIAAEGHHVAFRSGASNLVDVDANGVDDVFVRHLQTGETERVSVDSDGTDPGDASIDPTISANGRYVAFSSSADDLVEEDTNSRDDIFIRDRNAGTTVGASLGTPGSDPNGDSSGAAISASGRYVAFESAASDLIADDGNAVADVFVYDREAGTTNRVSIDTEGEDPDGPSSGAAISADGRYVAFDSSASNLIANDENSFADVFVHDFIGPPELLLAPPNYSFGAREVTAGPTEPFTLTVSNLGAGTLNIASIGLGGVDADEFEIAETCGATLAGGEGCDVNVVFDPTSAGVATAILEVTSDGGDGSSALSGQGTAPPASTGSDPGSGSGPNSQPGPGPTPQPGPGSNPQPGPGPRPRCAGRIATIVGSGRGETIAGTARRDVIVGTSGDDLIRGGGGRDLICGRGGDDRVLGGAGGDTLHGAAGNDRMAGNGGGDTLHGDSGADVLSGGGAGDELRGGSGRDRLDGGGGSDKLRGEAGADRCREGRGPQRAC